MESSGYHPHIMDTNDPIICQQDTGNHRVSIIKLVPTSLSLLVVGVYNVRVACGKPDYWIKLKMNYYHYWLGSYRDTFYTRNIRQILQKHNLNFDFQWNSTDFAYIHIGQCYMLTIQGSQHSFSRKQNSLIFPWWSLKIPW